MIGIVIYLGMLIAALVGWKLRKRFTDSEGERSHNEEGYVVSSVMGLLALLVGFTFALAIDRYDTRRAVVLEEANAIGTTYLRTQLLEEPHRTRISKLLTDYTANRVALAREKVGADQERRLAASDALIIELWQATVAAFPTMQTRPFSGSYLTTMNQMIDMDASRQQSRRAHVPMEVFLVLVIYQMIAAGVLGYVLGGRRGRTTASLLLVLFGGSLLLVIDIDRPNSGGIIETQKPMELLLDMMRKNPAGSFDRMAQAVPAQPVP
ncbi:hypothetical protein [Novosphingobium guangzhouense]|uniref:DUF4239 domain-containing protein n=1 Tax=Novosphingobium guangzhouense TaxID=1850347 RepID=A0A2K2FZE9_9SPHN|nr:hypothetical protein [Novosphingobium guangzhouense]PNU04157.1 hypothetical protein A8V01_05175 [Novosphingobium guangzhouense]